MARSCLPQTHHLTFRVWPPLSTMNMVTSTFLATLLPPFSNSPRSTVMYRSFRISPGRGGTLKPFYICSEGLWTLRGEAPVREVQGSTRTCSTHAFRRGRHPPCRCPRRARPLCRPRSQQRACASRRHPWG